MLLEKKCKWCGKTIQYRLGQNAPQFCSVQCHAAERESRYNADDTGPKMPMLDKNNISDAGVVALIEGIVTQAKEDVLNQSPGTQIREEAEAFFLSEEFSYMTNLDGFDILCKLQDQYDERQRKKEERKAHVSGTA